MRIICPACHAIYELTPAVAARLPARTRCARCRNEWEAKPPMQALVAEAAEAETVDIPPSPLPPDPVPRAPIMAAVVPEPSNAPAFPGAATATTGREPVVAPGGSGSALRSWLASLAILVVLTGLVLVLHKPISQAWPPSQRLYHALGIG